MKIFIDSAVVEEISEADSWGIIDGVTTNPSLIAKSGDFKEVIHEITSIVDGPISAETVALDSETMLKDARDFATWHPNIVVKIPLTAEGLKAVKILSAEGIKTNVTLRCPGPFGRQSGRNVRLTIYGTPGRYLSQRPYTYRRVGRTL